MPTAPPASAAPAKDRLTPIDALRGLALLGVLWVNLVTEFRVSLFAQFLGAPPASLVERAASSFVSLALEGKAIALFSMLFGLGLAMQVERLPPGIRPRVWLCRRLLALLGLGLVHLLFIWNGDILVAYAIVGLLVVPMLDLPPRSLFAIAAALLVVFATLPWLPLPVGLAGPEDLAAHVAQADRVYRAGSFGEVWQFEYAELPWLLPLHLYILPRTMALFLIGALAWRTGFVRRALARPQTLVALGFTASLLGGLLTAAGSGSLAPSLAGLEPVAASLAAPILAIGYGCLALAVFSRHAGSALVGFIASVGRMAFTNYVLQSAILSLLFFGYGLGLYGRTSVVQGLGIGAAIYALQAWFSRWWLRRYLFGPLEWCWRSLTYSMRQPMLALRSARPVTTTPPA
ncbi:MAG TPA: DUF418 domain-containing protein [Ideonella sp.]|nr:DUF418 domain-containing protein [Ideonella sp.]